jgi:hypothetical protein
VDARKTFLLKAMLSSRSGDDLCVIRPLVRGLCNTKKTKNPKKKKSSYEHIFLKL